MTGKRGRVCFWYIIMVLDQVCIATSCHYHDGVGQGDGMAQTIICIYQFNTTHSEVHIYTDFVALVHCSSLQVHIAYHADTTDEQTFPPPTGLPNSLLNWARVFRHVHTPYLLSRTQDVSVIFWFAFSPTLNLPYPTIKHQAVWLYTWLCLSNHFKLNKTK